MQKTTKKVKGTFPPGATVETKSKFTTLGLDESGGNIKPTKIIKI